MERSLSSKRTVMNTDHQSEEENIVPFSKLLQTLYLHQEESLRC